MQTSAGSAALLDYHAALLRCPLGAVFEADITRKQFPALPDDLKGVDSLVAEIKSQGV